MKYEHRLRFFTIIYIKRPIPSLAGLDTLWGGETPYPQTVNVKLNVSRLSTEFLGSVPFHYEVQKVYILPTLFKKEKYKYVVRIGSIIIFHLSEL